MQQSNTETKQYCINCNTICFSAKMSKHAFFKNSYIYLKWYYEQDITLFFFHRLTTIKLAPLLHLSRCKYSVNGALLRAILLLNGFKQFNEQVNKASKSKECRRDHLVCGVTFIRRRFRICRRYFKKRNVFKLTLLIQKCLIGN